MLQKLVIKNYALIDEVEIDFSDGFSIITGETGAGKSIMLGALGLLLGERADTKAVADKDRKTVVEATFLAGDELIVRREISPSGRSRAFIDDSPVTLPELRECTSRLLDIHSQHANLSLNSRDGQLAIIDAMAGAAPALEDYRRVFKEYVGVRGRIRRLRDIRQRNEERRAVITYQLDQLKKLNPKRGEQEEVERAFEMLSEADDIREHLGAAHYALDGGEGGALMQIAIASEDLESFNLAALEHGVAEEESLLARLKNVYVELKDIAETIERMGQEVESNPARLAATGERMKALLEAVKTFRVDSADDLVELRADLTKKLNLLDGDDDESRELESRARVLAKELKDKADGLTALRSQAAADFSARLTKRAIPLGLPNLRFETVLTSGKLTADGQDNPEFICSFNKNGHMLPMAATASGGELSRLTLSIKSLMAEKMAMPTVIFDEIDTGVSGEIADKMGRMMQEMASSMQIITITHLPQVAARGKRHYKVYKRDTDSRTISTVKELSAADRINEIAGMLSGETLTSEAVSAARALLCSTENPTS